MNFNIMYMQKMTKGRRKQIFLSNQQKKAYQKTYLEIKTALMTGNQPVYKTFFVYLFFLDITTHKGTKRRKNAISNGATQLLVTGKVKLYIIYISRL